MNSRLGGGDSSLFGSRIPRWRGVEDDKGRLMECAWQRKQLPDEIRELVLDDQRLRNHVCWFVFDG
jgi:predicted N-formylglutamate amidohydrolase